MTPPPPPKDKKKSISNTKKIRKHKKASDKSKGITMENVADIEEEIDFESLVTIEYNKLHRQYRLMENNRHLLKEEGKSILQKQNLLHLLQKQKKDMEVRLQNAESELYTQIDRKNISTILDILEFCDKTNMDIEWCIKNIEELEGNVTKITKRLVQQKLKVQGIYGQSLTVSQVDKRRRLLENRLYFYTTQFDTKVSINKSVREEINMMLKVRGMFHERLVTIKKMSSHLRGTMGEYVYLATQSYENRDDYVNKITQLREKNDKDSKQHVSDIRDLNRELSHDIKLRSFTSFKNSMRDVFETVEQRVERINTTKLKQMDQILQAHGESFHQVLVSSNHHSMESLVQDYNTKEQSNFAKFKFINDLNDEVKTIQFETISMGKDIEEMYKKSTQLDKEREKKIQAAMKKYTENQEKLKDMKEMDAKSQSYYDEIIQLLSGIYTVGECDKTSIAGLMGDNQDKISRSGTNAILSVKAIEKRIGDLLEEKKELEYRQAQAEETGKGHHSRFHHKSSQGKALLGKRTNAGGPYIPTLLITSHLDGEEEDEELVDRSNQPLAIQELRLKIIDKLRRMAEASLKMSALGINARSILSLHGSKSASHHSF